MSTAAFTCPQCGFDTETLREGCCEDCRQDNQLRLDEHNAQYDRWQRLSDEQRSAEIRRAIRGEQ